MEKNQDEPWLIILLKSIRIRGLILEALLYETSRRDDRCLHTKVLKIGYRSADVIEHLAQDALEKKRYVSFIVQSLESALYLLSEFEDLLNSSGLILPTKMEVNDLIKKVKSMS